MKPNANDQDVKNANIAVEKAFEAIIKEVKTQLKHFPTEELRTYVQRESTENESKSFYNPMIYISIRDNYGKKIISFAKNLNVKMHIGIELDSLLARTIYRLTSQDVTKLMIEDRIEQYAYYSDRFRDALKQTESKPNYKKEVVSTAA